jgi:hypothetical protein
MADPILCTKCPVAATSVSPSNVNQAAVRLTTSEKKWVGFVLEYFRYLVGRVTPGSAYELRLSVQKLDKAIKSGQALAIETAFNETLGALSRRVSVVKVDSTLVSDVALKILSPSLGKVTPELKGAFEKTLTTFGQPAAEEKPAEDLKAPVWSKKRVATVCAIVTIGAVAATQVTALAGRIQGIPLPSMDLSAAGRLLAAYFTGQVTPDPVPVA